MEEIIIKEKDDSVSFEAIQELLTAAHMSNAEKGLIYATANQSVDKLKAKIGEDGVCFIAMLGDVLAGTVTISFRELNYWYHSGEVAIIKLLGVSPEFKGRHISSKLIEKCIECAEKKGRRVIIADSAEQNVILRNLLHKYGFLTVDYCKYAANNFYTNVYVRWLDGCPHSRLSRSIHYKLKRMKIRLKYKPDTGKK